MKLNSLHVICLDLGILTGWHSIELVIISRQKEIKD